MFSLLGQPCWLCRPCRHNNSIAASKSSLRPASPVSPSSFAGNACLCSLPTSRPGLRVCGAGAAAWLSYKEEVLRVLHESGYRLPLPDLLNRVPLMPGLHPSLEEEVRQKAAATAAACGRAALWAACFCRWTGCVGMVPFGLAALAVGKAVLACMPLCSLQALPTFVCPPLRRPHGLVRRALCAALPRCAAALWCAGRL